jgi:serine/threonine-protein kinase
MNEEEGIEVQFALQDVSARASRYGVNGVVSQQHIQPSLRLLVDSWPARLHRSATPAGDIEEDFCVWANIGEGGCSQVSMGYHRESGQMVAVKTADVSGNPNMPLEIAERALRQEYAILTGLEEGTGPRVFSDPESRLHGRLCMVMEYLTSEDLHDSLGRLHHGLNTAQGLDRVLNVGYLAVQSIAALHRQKVVHADIKPENFKFQENRVRPFDFGIARRFGESWDMICGTPLFMPPESFLGAEANPQRDVFALGATLYWLVTGEMPYPGETNQEIIQKLGDPKFRPVPPSEILLRNHPELREQVSAERLQRMDHIILRALHRNPEVRYRDAGVFLQALTNIVSVAEAPVSAPFVSPPVQAAPQALRDRASTRGDLPSNLARVSRRRSAGG